MTHSEYEKRESIMKYLKQFIIILGISFAGEFIKYVLPLPIPASIYGMVILFVGLLTGVIKLDMVKDTGKFPVPASVYGLILMLAALMSGLLKTEQVKETAAFLVEIMPVMFIPAGVGLMNAWEELVPIIVPVGIITVVTNITVMAVAGRTSQWMIRREKNKEKEKSE